MSVTIKIDCHAIDGTHDHVIAIMQKLQKYQANATFFINVGIDESGWYFNRLWKNPLYQYPKRSSLYGLLLPAPDVGKKCSHLYRELNHNHFDIGLKTANPVEWHRIAHKASDEWIERKINFSIERFSKLIGWKPQSFSAPYFQTHHKLFELEDNVLNCNYASDTRGSFPFRVKVGDTIHRCIQIPTTLPTIEECVAHNMVPTEIIKLLTTETQKEGHHVFSFSTELKKTWIQKLLEPLLKEWKQQGHELISLQQHYREIRHLELPICEIYYSDVLGYQKPITLQKVE